MLKVHYDTIIDATAVIIHERFNKDQKKAARSVLEIALGPTKNQTINRRCSYSSR